MNCSLAWARTEPDTPAEAAAATNRAMVLTFIVLSPLLFIWVLQ